MHRADPQGVVSDVYVALDLSQVYPDDPASLHAANLLRHLDLCHRLRRSRQERCSALRTEVNLFGQVLIAAVRAGNATLRFATGEVQYDRSSLPLCPRPSGYPA